MSWWQILLTFLAFLAAVGLSIVLAVAYEKFWVAVVGFVGSFGLLIAVAVISSRSTQNQYAEVCHESGGVVVAISKFSRTCIEARIIPIDGKRSWTL